MKHSNSPRFCREGRPGSRPPDGNQRCHDYVLRKEVEAGAIVTPPVDDQIYGDRSGQIKDGHLWSVQTHVKDVAPAEMQRRVEAVTSNA